MYVRSAQCRLRFGAPLSDNLAAPACLRGAIATLFPDLVLLHQHDGTSCVYLYPRLQYRVEDGQGLLLGVEEGADLVTDLASGLEGRNLRIGQQSTRITDVSCMQEEVEFGIADQRQYRFTSPWLGLNSKNYDAWKRATPNARQQLLERCLTGNVLSMSKSLGYDVTTTIVPANLALRSIRTTLKGVPMVGFLGCFKMNFLLPAGWGLGKSVSRGFGATSPLYATDD